MKNRLSPEKTVAIPLGGCSLTQGERWLWRQAEQVTKHDQLSRPVYKKGEGSWRKGDR